MPTIRAIDSLVRVYERRARLLGLDEPRKTAITLFTHDAIMVTRNRAARAVAECVSAAEPDLESSRG